MTMVVAIVNADDAYAEKLIKICEAVGHKIISFGRNGKTIKLLSYDPAPKGQEIKISVDGKTFQLTIPLVGEFQVMNVLCALGLLLSQDNNAEKYIPLLEQLRGVAGRLQLVPAHPKGAVYVDYAHKPAALEAVLNALRPHTQGKLVCIFGCGGNRDHGKRAMMGKISSELADVTIITDDNPRDENPKSIRTEILESAPDAKEIADRAEAIKYAVEGLEEGDVLLVAGKGMSKVRLLVRKYILLMM